MPKKKKVTPDESAESLLAYRSLMRFAEDIERETEQEKIRDWEKAWGSLAGETYGQVHPWRNELIGKVRHLAKVICDQGSQQDLDDVAQRITNWLGKFNVGEVCDWPMATFRVSRELVDEHTATMLEGVLLSAMVLKRAIHGEESLIPIGADESQLLSTSWSRLQKEVAEAPDLPLEAVKSRGMRSCGEGHTWEMASAPDKAIRCPVCENEKAERKRKVIEGFIYRLDIAANECRFTYQDEPDVYDNISTLNERLVFAAHKKGLCPLDAAVADSARLVIRWAVSETSEARTAVTQWSVEDAIKRLQGGAVEANPTVDESPRLTEPAVDGDRTGAPEPMFKTSQLRRMFFKDGAILSHRQWGNILHDLNVPRKRVGNTDRFRLSDVETRLPIGFKREIEK